MIDLSKCGAYIFQRNEGNLLPRHCARGNFIFTKIIKLIEESTLRRHFKIFSLIESQLIVTTK